MAARRPNACAWPTASHWWPCSCCGCPALSRTGERAWALAAHSAVKLTEDFDATGSTLQLQLPATRSDALKNHLRDATRNRVRFAEPDPE